MELYGGTEDSVCTFEPIQKSDHLQHAVHFLFSGGGSAEFADTWLPGIWNDHIGIFADDVLADRNRCDHRVDSENVSEIVGYRGEKGADAIPG